MHAVTTLGYALLGLLARGAQSGYDLSRHLRRPVGFFWQARHSQIYAELARLEAQELVGHTVVEQRDRPDKKVYAITDAGRAVLQAWVSAPLEMPPVRDELVLRAYSLWLADPRAAASLFREHALRHEAQLEQYRQIEAEMVHGAGGLMPPVDSPGFAAYATLKRGLGYEHEYAAWCLWVAEQLETGASETADAAPGTESPAAAVGGP